MTTDTSERGLERLICTALTGAPCDPGAGPATAVHERPRGVRRRLDLRRARRLRPRVLRRPRAAFRLSARDAAGPRRRARPRPGRPDAAQVPRPPAGRDHEARHDRRPAPRLKHGPHHLDLFYGTPSPGNPKAAEQNIRPTASASRASSATAATRRSARSTCASSSTACRSPPSS